MSDELRQVTERIARFSEATCYQIIPLETVHEVAKIAQAYLAIIARLPHTADGVPVICDGMTVYCPRGHSTTLSYPMSRVYCCEGDCWGDGCQSDSGSGTYYQFEQCRSALGIEVTK